MSSNNHCMTPGCRDMAAGGDYYCPTCRALQNNSAVGMLPVFVDEPEAVVLPTPPLDVDLAALAGWLVKDQQEREDVIRRQQERLDRQDATIQSLSGRLNDRINEIAAEQVRADGLQQQVDGLRAQLMRMNVEPLHPAPNGHQARNDPKPGRLSRWLRAVVGG